MGDRKQIYTAFLTTLKQWQVDTAGTPSILASLGIMREQTSQQLIERYLERLQQNRPSYHLILHERFLTGKRVPVKEVSTKLGYSETTIQHKQSDAIYFMVDWLLADEAAAQIESRNLLLSKLPPPTYTDMIGADVFIEQVREQITAASAAQTTLVAGMGGIGKTSIVDAAVRLAIPTSQYEHLVYVHYLPTSAAGHSLDPVATFEQVLMALAGAPHINTTGLPTTKRNALITQALANAPHLVIIDNLEEAADVKYVLSQLPSYAGISHFVVTSRILPTQGNAFMLPMSELAPPADVELLQHEATVRNIKALQRCTVGQLQQIVDLVGGNPMALKLAASLAHYMPFNDVIEDLELGRSEDTKKTYRHIFRSAWRGLSDDAKRVLQGMVLNPRGGKFEQLQRFSGLETGALWDAIAQLSNRCLLEPRDSDGVTRYGLHRLTATFIRTDVLGLDG